MPQPLGRRLAIRTRIALTIFGVATAILVVMAVTVFLVFRKALADSFDDTLRLRATANLALLEIEEGTVHLRVAEPATADGDDEPIVRLYTPGRAAPAVNGSATTPTAAESALVGRAMSGDEAIATISYSSHSFRVLARPVSQSGQVIAVLVTGLPWEKARAPLNILRAVLLVAVPLTSIVLGVAAFLIARRALRPVHAITTTARQIAAGDVTRRIEAMNARDEVGELAATFNTMIGRLAETIERERRFTGDASHELRTPLTAMEAAIEVTLSQSRTAAEYRRVLHSLRLQTGRMTRMARQLLMLSRLDEDAMRLEGVPVDLGDLLDAVIEAFQTRYPDMSVVAEALPSEVVVLADPEMLARAFTNILENAAVHAGHDTAIRIEARREANAVRLTFTDSGPGFPASLLPTAFQRFRRGDVSRSRGGAGLGLSIVASIVRLHGGTVEVGNAAVGAVVQLRLPLLVAEATSTPHAR